MAIPDELLAGAGLAGAKTIEGLSSPATLALIAAAALGGAGVPGMILSGGLSLDMLKNAYRQAEQAHNLPPEAPPREKIAGYGSAAIDALLSVLPWLREAKGVSLGDVKDVVKSQARQLVGQPAEALPVQQPAGVSEKPLLPLTKESVPVGPVNQQAAPPAGEFVPEIPQWIKEREARDAERAAAYDKAMARRTPPAWADMGPEKPSGTSAGGLLQGSTATNIGQISPEARPSTTALPTVTEPITAEAKKTLPLKPKPRGKGREETLEGAVKSMGGIRMSRIGTDLKVGVGAKTSRFKSKYGLTMFDAKALRESGLSPIEVNKLMNTKGGVLQHELAMRLNERGFNFADDEQAWNSILDVKKRRMTARDFLGEGELSPDSQLDEAGALIDRLTRERDDFAAKLEALQKQNQDPFGSIDPPPPGGGRDPGEEGFARIKDDRQSPFRFMPIDIPGQSKDQAAIDLFDKILKAPDAAISKRELLGLQKKKKPSAGEPLLNPPTMLRK
jgi:hypothetical protein